ncbi:ASKHA domain-containing protein [Lachnospiraceae bacterium ZAX-1]
MFTERAVGKMPKVIFPEEGKAVVVPPGSSILDAARMASVALEAPCNGMGTCKKCRVQLQSKNSNYVLACQSKAYDQVAVFVESKEQENQTLQIRAKGNSFLYETKAYIAKKFHHDTKETTVYGGDVVIGVEAGDTSNFLYGICVDIGTTTLVAALINLATGEQLAIEHALNPQSTYAQDVLTRIHFASSDGGNGTKILKNVLDNTLNEMIGAMAKVANVDRQHIYETVYSGNTAMLHLACGINPKPLGQYPYTSQIEGDSYLPAVDLNISPFALIYLPPIISAFVGPDITSGILASQLFERKETTIFIDVGTNGEMVLAHFGMLAATSTAAGPAFEGMNITCGMRAAAGAVERFSIAEETHEIAYSVIGGGVATGICGSGLLDIVGELVRVGLIGKTGKFIALDKSKYDGLRIANGKTVFYITNDVYLTQKDVRQIQLAKGAIRSGVEALLEQLDMKAADVDNVEIAGSFGYHLSEDSLLNIGLLPPEFKGKATFVGNTSQSGGTAFLLNTDFRKTMAKVVKHIEKIELSNSEGFEKRFVKSLGF